MKKNLNLLLLFAASLFTATTASAIGGQTSVYVGQTFTYTYSAGTLIVGASWSATKGDIVSTSLLGTTYSADVTWTTVGTGSVTILNGSHAVVSTLSVTVMAVPVPPNPSTTFSIANNCGNSVVTRNSNPGSGITWYWQTSSTGTSTTSSATTFTVTSASTAVWLRARYNASPSGWSSGSQSAGTIAFKTIPNASASAQIIFSGGQSSVAITNPNGVSGTTYAWTAAGSGTSGYSSGTGTPIAQMLTVLDQSTSGTATYTITPTANSCSGTPVTAVVTVHAAPFIKASTPNMVTPPVTLSANQAYDSYSWKNSAGTQVGTSSTYNVTTAGAYTLTVTRSGASASSEPVPITGQFSGQAENYIVSYDVQVDGITPATFLDTQTPENVAQSVQYFDGLGRPIQTVSTKASPTLHDAIQPFMYDQFGREFRKYLPYTTTNTSYGLLRDSGDPFDGSNNYNGTALNFYNNSADKVADDSRYFSETVFEPSPLMRPTQDYGPGSAWYSATKPVVHDYKINVDGTGTAGQEKLPYWTITTATVGGQSVNLVVRSGYWPTGSFDVKVTKDENGNQVREFTDKQGRLLVKKNQYTAAADTYNDAHWTMTTYVYDDFDRLRFVLPPEFNTKISKYDTATSTSRNNLLTSWCFQYTYDERGRMATKQVPGAKRVDMVYDQWDRNVLVQDGNQRANNKWTFAKYDNLNRMIMMGEFSSSNDRAAMVTAVNAISNRYENTATSSVGYTTNLTYPTTATISDLLTIAYFDDYSFKTNLTLGTAYDFTTVSGTGFPTAYNAATEGKPTGTKNRILGTSNWLVSATYYDDRYRVIQSIGDDHLGNKNRTTNVYYGITSWVTKSKLNHGSILTSVSETDYDHKGRPTKTYLTMDAGPRIIVSSMSYNEIGQLVEKNLHSEDAGTTYLQSIDYRHNIRGWIKSVNNSALSNDSGATNDDTDDLFGMQVNYESAVSVNGSTSNAPAQYNGNIAAIQWGTNNLKDTPTQKIYGYTYDPLNRLSQATYAANNSGAWTANGNQFNEALTYDKNGNILSLNRNTLFGGSTTAIDQLAYVYTSGNQLTTVTDNSSYYNQADNNPDYGFSEITHAAITEYTYDDNGSMTSDLNKGITSITYNYLNKPTVVTLASPTRTLTFTYDATGTKLKKVANNNGTQVAQSDYVGPIQYEGTTTSSLAFMSMPEGRVVKAGANWNYEYFLKDHLGNNRVVFAYTNQTDEYKATMETEAATAEEAQFQNLPATRLNLVTYNHTSKSYLSPTPTRVAETNGYTSKTIGPAKMLQVHTGDTVQASVFARYTTGTGGSTAIVNNLLTAVTGAYGILGTDAAYTGFSNNLPTISGSLGAYSNVPKAYLIYILFNSTFTSYQFGYQMVSSTAMSGHEKLSTNVTVTSPYNNGYLYVYMANESNVAGASSVYFDDVYVKHIKATKALQVMQTNDYFPFGMGINSLAYQKGVKVKNDYLYNGNENQDDFGLNWLDYGERFYSAEIGRWQTVDLLAEKMRRSTPYNFTRNNPISYIDPDGMEAKPLEGDGYSFVHPESMGGGGDAIGFGSAASLMAGSNSSPREDTHLNKDENEDQNDGELVFKGLVEDDDEDKADKLFYRNPDFEKIATGGEEDKDKKKDNGPKDYWHGRERFWEMDTKDMKRIDDNKSYPWNQDSYPWYKSVGWGTVEAIAWSLDRAVTHVVDPRGDYVIRPWGYYKAEMREYYFRHKDD